MIPFNRPSYTGNEDQYVFASMRSDKISGDGEYSKKCQNWFKEKLKCPKAMLTPSCTQALEMAALLIGTQLGDEVIMPSYSFTSAANAFVLRGAKIVFVDIRPDTMNINEALIEAAITEKTIAIVLVHYAGVACEMETIIDIAHRHALFVIEDAAQGMMSTYKKRYLGTLGHIATYSFHETKNFTSGGEGGLLIINDKQFIPRAEIIREKGTNRNQFFRGMVDKYSWIDVGSSYLPSEIQAAYLWGQLEKAEEITTNRLESWNAFYNSFKPLEQSGAIDLPVIPYECEQNGHMFYIKLKNHEQRSRFIKHLKANNVMAVFHYIPLHSAPAGIKYGRFHGDDQYTTIESEKLVRLPLYYGMSRNDLKYLVKVVLGYFS